MSNSSAPAQKIRTFDIAEIQARLGAMPVYPGKTNGRFDAATQRAFQAALFSRGVDNARNWNRARLAVAIRQMLCQSDGIDAGPVDGLIGPQTRHALEVYEARLNNSREPETWRDEETSQQPPLPQPPADELHKATARWPRQKDCPHFFGKPGANQTRLHFPYPMRLAWDTDTIVASTLCHEKIHDAALRVLGRVLDHYGAGKIAMLGLDLFGGCLNVRKMRGGSAWSMHSWGIAFDFDPARNQLRWGRDRAAFARPAYEKWFDLWEEEGAVSLGRAKNYDWMHIQFARL